ncbi:helix-turn-helix domain-containing protein [Brevibacillus sp. IT-7CA2]|uniref:helix-turn-helix domain-containing protein n=1 Tax=Brevibacillus sp. IT-7CA2 TaxID=3026436 RepID=UPI0039E0487F
MNPLEHIMDVDEASKLWGLQPSYIKDLCRLKLQFEGKAVKKGKTWILDKNQSNPGQPGHPKNWRAKKDENNLSE